MFVKSLRQAIPQSKIGDFCQPPRHRWPWGGGIEGPSGRPVPTRKTGCGAFDPAAVVIVTWREGWGCVLHWDAFSSGQSPWFGGFRKAFGKGLGEIFRLRHVLFKKMCYNESTTQGRGTDRFEADQSKHTFCYP